MKGIIVGNKHNTLERPAQTTGYRLGTEIFERWDRKLPELLAIGDGRSVKDCHLGFAEHDATFSLTVLAFLSLFPLL
jgi:hypothetical protein